MYTLLFLPMAVGKGVLFFPILEKYGKRTALAYLGAMIVEPVLLVMGALSLLMIVPLGQVAADAGGASVGWANALGSLAQQSNIIFYQAGEMSLALGGLFLCPLLFRTRLIPRFLAAWGVIGYAIFLTGTITEILGIHIGLVPAIPGGLWELVFGFWLVIKGFQPEAYAAGASVAGAEVVMTSTVRLAPSAPTPAAL